MMVAAAMASKTHAHTDINEWRIFHVFGAREYQGKKIKLPEQIYVRIIMSYQTKHIRMAGTLNDTRECSFYVAFVRFRPSWEQEESGNYELFFRH